MAEASTTKKAKKQVFVPKTYAGDEPMQFISVNGVAVLAPKGKMSEMPAEIAEEYERSLRAQEALDDAKNGMLSNQ